MLVLRPAKHLGYALADSPASTSYTPIPFYSWNSGGFSVGVTKIATGYYTVTWIGLALKLLDGGDVQVSALATLGVDIGGDEV